MRDLDQNAVAVYHLHVKPHLKAAQVHILSAYNDGYDHTDHEVADILRIGINRVSGRVGELLKLGILEKATYRKSRFSSIPSRACRKRTQYPEQHTLFG